MGKKKTKSFLFFDLDFSGWDFGLRFDEIDMFSFVLTFDSNESFVVPMAIIIMCVSIFISNCSAIFIVYVAETY